MDLRPINDNENPPLQRTTASRAATAKERNDKWCFSPVFNGALSSPRNTRISVEPPNRLSTPFRGGA